MLTNYSVIKMQQNLYILLIIFTNVILIKFSFARYAPRVMNATISDLTYFPCMVQIINANNEHVCGGCVLDKENVLTSARCVKDSFQEHGKTNLKVRGGDVVISRSNLPTYQIRDVWQFVVHPDYNEASLENDLALLKIKDPFMPSANLHPMGAGVTGPKGRCFLPGWADDKRNTSVLHYITLYITNEDKCTKKVQNAICAESKSNEGACTADLGGPLVCGRNVYGVFIGPEGACEGKPALFTNLSPFEDWMDLKIHQDDTIGQPSRRHTHSRSEIDPIFSCSLKLLIVAITCSTIFEISF